MTQLATCSAVAPATPNQERILFGREVARRLGWQLKPDMVTLAIDVSGPLAVEKLGAAIQAAVDKHPCLRTRIVRNPELDEQDMLSAIEHFRRTGLPLRSPFLQVVSPRVAVQLNLVTLSAAGDRPMEIKDAIAREFATPFPEGSECPLRAQLVSVGEDTYFLLVTIDHLFADGWSLDVLFHDIVRSYPEPTTKAVRTAVQEIGAPGYHSYDGERADVHYWANHWSQFAADRLPTRAIPFAKLSPLKGEPVFGRVGSVLSGDAIVGVRSLCKRLRTTPYRLFLAAVLIVLQHYTKRKRLAVWTHCANRSYPGAHDVIGCLMNTHLMGFEFSPTLTGRELLPTVAAEHNPTLRMSACHCLAYGKNSRRCLDSLTPVFWSTMSRFDPARRFTNPIAAGSRSRGVKSGSPRMLALQVSASTSGTSETALSFNRITPNRGTSATGLAPWSMTCDPLWNCSARTNP